VSTYTDEHFFDSDFDQKSKWFGFTKKDIQLFKNKKLPFIDNADKYINESKLSSVLKKNKCNHSQFFKLRQLIWH
jgi:hypothetical protein